MELSNEKKREYIRRLLLSRMRILVTNGFYGLLLMHMTYAIDEDCDTAATNGMKIYFGPKFLDELSDSELDFVMMHEILHVVLQHVLRGEGKDDERFNIACDIVVNSNILLSNGMKPSSITLEKYGESMHFAPNGKEGYEYTVEEVYEMLPPTPQCHNKRNNSKGVGLGRAKHGQQERNNGSEKPTWDDHSMWGMYEENSTLKDVWVKRFEDACEAMSVRKAVDSCGNLPMFAQRLLKELKKPQTDWRTVLNDFVQEEVVDYSFSPPDRRFDDSPFFMPDFNGMEDKVEDILFMIDTSASMSDDMITAAYSEVKGAIDQFDGKLKGWLGFFDAAIIEPKPFENDEEFKIIKPVGGGGTDFQIIFEYVAKHMADKLPASIIILTDGYAKFPPEHFAMNIPVLWLLNNEKVTPPWGKIARIEL